MSSKSKTISHLCEKQYAHYMPLKGLILPDELYHILTKGNTLWARQRKGNLHFWEGKYKGKLMESKGYFSKLFVCFVGFHF